LPVFRFYEFPTDEVKNAIIEKVVEQSEGCLHFGYMEIEGIDDKSFCFCPVKEFDVEIFEFENTPRILKSKNAKTILTEKECRLYGLPYTNKNSYRAEVKH